MAKYKNPYAEGTLAFNIWWDDYLSGKIDALEQFNKSMPSEKEIREEMSNKLDLMIAKFQNKIM